MVGKRALKAACAPDLFIVQPCDKVAGSEACIICQAAAFEISDNNSVIGSKLKVIFQVFCDILIVHSEIAEIMIEGFAGSQAIDDFLDMIDGNGKPSPMEPISPW